VGSVPNQLQEIQISRSGCVVNFIAFEDGPHGKPSRCLPEHWARGSSSALGIHGGLVTPLPQNGFTIAKIDILISSAHY
jgi:hypothetical protein